MIKENERAEFIGQIIDTFEDFLDEKGIIIPNGERDMDPGLEPENSANIYGTDYGNLQSALEETFINWGILESEIPMAEYLFKVSLNGVPCEGTLSVKASDEDTAYQMAQDMVSDRLCTAFPELDVEYGIDFVDSDSNSAVSAEKYPKYRITSKRNRFDAEETVVETSSLDKAKALFREKMEMSVNVSLETVTSEAAKWEVMQYYCRK